MTDEATVVPSGLSEGPDAVQCLLRSKLKPGVFSLVNDFHCKYLAEKGFTFADALEGITQDQLPSDVFNEVLRLQIPRAFSLGVASAALPEEQAQQLQALYDELQQAQKTVSISKVGATAWNRVAEKGGLTIQVGELAACSTSKQTDSFGWDDRNERAQFDRYLPHLRNTIGLSNRKLDWVDAAKDARMLNTNCSETLGRDFRGTTDVIITERSAIKVHHPQSAIHAAFELKKKVAHDDSYQAKATLLCCNIHSPKTKPIVVLTDLMDDWSLLWLSGRAITIAAFDNRSHAIGFMEKLLASSISNSESIDEDVPTFSGNEGPLADSLSKRRRIAPSLITSIGASDALSEQIQSLQGLVPEAELTQMRVEQALRELYEHPTAAALRPASQPSCPSYIV